MRYSTVSLSLSLSLLTVSLLFFQIYGEGSIDWSTNPAYSKFYHGTPNFASKTRIFGPFVKLETAQFVFERVLWRKVSSALWFDSSIFSMGNIQLFVYTIEALKMILENEHNTYFIHKNYMVAKTSSPNENWNLHFICFITWFLNKF